MATTVITSSSAAISAVETYVSTPFTTATAGTAVKVTLVGTTTATYQCNPTLNLRVGSAGTIADTLVASLPLTVPASTTPVTFTAEFIATIQSSTAVSAYGTAGGSFGLVSVNNAATVSSIADIGVSALGVIGALDQATLTSGSSSIALAPAGSINSLATTFAAGTGGTAGTYSSVALSGGTGSGATATFVVGSGGTITSVTLVSAGTGYAVGDVLSASSGSIGSTTGFSIAVASLSGFPRSLGILNIGTPVMFTSALGGFSANTVYYVVAVTNNNASSISLSATAGGTAITASASGVVDMKVAQNCFITINQAIVQQM